MKGEPPTLRLRTVREVNGENLAIITVY